MDFVLPTLRRLTYVLPLVNEPPRYFALPDPEEVKHEHKYARSGPLLQAHPRPPKKRSSSGDAPTTSSRLYHSLPISSLAIDTSTVVANTPNATPQGILYAGGRDGFISAWDLGLPMTRTRRQNRGLANGLGDYDDESTSALLDTFDSELHDNLKAVAGSSPGVQDDSTSATFRQCIGTHTDWIHEVLLCNRNQTVVSASSDGNVNIWNPHDKLHCSQPQVLGTHKDYVKALTHASAADWIASGSFDKTIKIWDIKELRSNPILTMRETDVVSSVYSLSANRSGTVMAGGSPERVVRLWDPRSGHQISQLVGHSDTVRKVLLSEDGAHLLSASSDATVRLWSVGEQRCLHTFTHHPESVWALHSEHPRLDVFYSGDRTGLLCKVDWERCNEVSEGECVLLGKGDSVTSCTGKFTSEKSSYGITSIISFDDTHVWTANANGTVDRWQDVGSRVSREALYPLVAPVPADPHSRFDTAGIVAASPVPRVQALRESVNFGSSKVAFDSRDAIEGRVQRTKSLFGIPFDSLICLAPPNDPYGAAIGLGSISQRAASRVELGAHASIDADKAGSLISLPSQSRNHAGASTGTAAMDMDARSPGSLQQQLEQQAAITAGSPATPTFGTFAAGGGNVVRPSSVRSGSLRFAPADTRHEYDALDGDDGDDDEVEQASLEARLAFEERDLASDAKPWNSEPKDVIHCRHGLVRCTLLNDRRHCLTVDSDGLICLWDIITGSCIGAFVWDDMLAAARADGLMGDVSPGEALEIVKERVQGFGAAPIWCTVDTRIGLLSVHLEYPRCFDAEVYVEEFDPAYQKLPAAEIDDQRLNVGRLLCKSLFAGFAERERTMRVEGPAAMSLGKLALEQNGIGDAKSPTASGNAGGVSGMRIPTAILPTSPAILPLETPLLHVSTHHLSDLYQLVSSQSATTSSRDRRGQAHQYDYFSLQKSSDAPNRGTTPRGAAADGSPVTPGVVSPTSPGGGKLMGRLRLGLRREGTTSRKQGPKTPGGTNNSKAQASEDGTTPDVPASEAERQLQAVRKLITQFTLTQRQRTEKDRHDRSGTKLVNDPILLAFAPKTELIIAESSHDSGGYQVKYRGIVGQTQDDVAELEVQSPLWLLEQIFEVESDANGPPLGQREKDKLTFLLIPWEGVTGTEKAVGNQASNGDLSSSQHESIASAPPQDLSASQELQKLPPIPTGTSRLTATRMLRIGKACTYVADKLRLIEQQGDETAGLSSGFSSIAASRRGSLAPGGAAPQTGSVNGALALSKAIQARTANVQASELGLQQLRRPSAMSVSSSVAAGLNAAPSHVMPPGSKASDYIEIICRDEVMPANVTLAQIQRYTWKSGSPIKLEYRWKSGLNRIE